jgi:hypothetical protein
MNKSVAFLAIVALVVLGFVVGYFERITQPSRPASPVAGLPGPSVSPASPPAQPQTLRIFTVAENGGGDANDLKPETVAFDGGTQPARFAINSLIQAKDSPLPQGTSLRSIKIDDGLATVDFSKALQANFHGSDTQEAQAVNSILMTLGQFPSIRQVQILVDGSAIDSLGGHFDISGPLDVVPVQQSASAQ